MGRPPQGARTVGQGGFPTEIEVKVRVEDPRAFLARFPGVRFVGEELQADTYFVRPRRELLRLREIVPVDPRGPKRFVLGHKRILDRRNTVFDEHETEVRDGAALLEILRRLGYRRDVVVRKRRRTYRIPPFTIEMNAIAGVGLFADIEILTPDAASGRRRLSRLLERTGISSSDLVPTLYTDLVRGSRSARRTLDPGARHTAHRR